eukprot:g32276.t1
MKSYLAQNKLIVFWLLWTFVDNFCLALRRLAEVDERQQEQAVDRFQRKLNAEFIHFFWQLLLRRSRTALHFVLRLSTSQPDDVFITQTSLLRSLLDPDANSIFQDHEVLYMLRIFEQMKFRFDREGGDKGGRERERGLPMSYYLTGLTLVSMIPTKIEKLELIFQAFDMDADHCLLYKQIFELCHCVSVLKVMVEESNRVSKLFFQVGCKSAGLHRPFQEKISRLKVNPERKVALHLEDT